MTDLPKFPPVHIIHWEVREHPARAGVWEVQPFADRAAHTDWLAAFVLLAEDDDVIEWVHSGVAHAAQEDVPQVKARLNRIAVQATAKIDEYFAREATTSPERYQELKELLELEAISAASTAGDGWYWIKYP